MKKLKDIMIMSVCSLMLGGCAVSGAGLGSSSAQKQPVLAESTLPSLPQIEPSNDLALAAASDKFSKSDQQTLVAGDEARSFDAVEAEFRQAYAEANKHSVAVSTEHASLKPYVGRWQLQAKGLRGGARDGVAQQVAANSGFAEACEVVLEDQPGGYGYRATGTSACPTSLFMLDSWVAFDDRIVLRDHMGDDIIKLRSDGRGVWAGVNKEGDTLVLKKS
nr:AprI/Inh family metalloprotease inhibitor [uncultured Cohaesibacter sp.]